MGFRNPGHTDGGIMLKRVKQPTGASFQYVQDHKTINGKKVKLRQLIIRWQM